MIRDEGIITEDERGRERKNRAITVLNQASKEFRLMAGQFGLTPAMRSRLEVAEPEAEDDAFFGF